MSMVERKWAGPGWPGALCKFDVLYQLAVGGATVPHVQEVACKCKLANQEAGQGTCTNHSSKDILFNSFVQTSLYQHL